MAHAGRLVTILMAEDDDDDFLLAHKAFERAQLLNDVRRVRDGVELLAALRADGALPPTLILLDLNMPRMDGREALVAIRADPRLRSLPVVVMTSSKSDEDISRSYELGVNSFIRKPVSLEQLVEVFGVLKRYWLEIVELPDPSN
jgi:two-component system response regulator